MTAHATDAFVNVLTAIFTISAGAREKGLVSFFTATDLIDLATDEDVWVGYTNSLYLTVIRNQRRLG